MSLPKVSVQAVPGEPPVVTVDGSPIAGVRSAQITVSADHLPQVALVLAVAEVDVELPAGVTVLRAGPRAVEFADSLSVPRLEAEAAGALDQSMGEAFAAAVRTQAAEFDAAHDG
jgi:hypothetical protein